MLRTIAATDGLNCVLNLSFFDFFLFGIRICVLSLGCGIVGGGTNGLLDPTTEDAALDVGELLNMLDAAEDVAELPRDERRIELKAEDVFDDLKDDFNADDVRLLLKDDDFDDVKLELVIDFRTELALELVVLLDTLEGFVEENNLDLAALLANEDLVNSDVLVALSMSDTMSSSLCWRLGSLLNRFLNLWVLVNGFGAVTVPPRTAAAWKRLIGTRIPLTVVNVC